MSIFEYLLYIFIFFVYSWISTEFGGYLMVGEKLENNVLQPPLAWSSNRRMKIDDWIRPYYKNLRSPFVPGGMRWKLQEGQIVRVSVNEC